ncbi:signal peptide peptidase SppA [Pasteurellaceae bacterium HPA106]|uniref:signal peptide peptidase SppA n=1 Tax=Spirabiliibacterium pneumoniae TaxID=221400 RepID=UPI001AAD6479|nr:signal peptide peptidase SppA [Spirabiliibacterium pneumoniae]MBE2896157.1 signal peptide peptidase SppA [Spirabiliibacterium pneumoniae]
MQAILSLLRFVWRALCFVRDLVLNVFFVLFVLLCFGVTALFIRSSSDIPEPAGALVLNLDGFLADNRPTRDVLGLLQEFDERNMPRQISTFDVVNAITTAQRDDRIKGIVLDLNYFIGGDVPSLQFIGDALKDFKASGKPVYALGHNYSQKQYLLASYADKIFLNPVGEVELQGVATNTLFFKSLLDKLDVTPHIFRVGTYKAAVEPFMRDDMSVEAKANTALWLNQLWQNYERTIAQNRNIEQSAILPEPAQLIAQLKANDGDSAQYALNHHFVSALADDHTINNELAGVFGKDEDGHYQHITLSDYVALLPSRFDIDAENKIAVVNVEGEIIDGYSTAQAVGGDSVVEQLERVGRDDSVKGLILRVNSPGGSAFASELIRQSLQALRAKGLPVVVSMGGMAASGGYWISANADKIIASPNTLTGSIGIFSAFFTVEKSLAKLGIHSDGVATSPLSQVALTNPLPKAVEEYLQLSIEHGYQQFLTLVAQGRHMSREQVDSVAQGQVWLGQTALDKKLVDQLGDFNTAVDETITLINAKRTQAGLANAEHVKVQWFVEQDDSLLGKLLSDGQAKAKQIVLNAFGITPQSPLGMAAQQLGTLSHFNDPNGQYLYCLDCGLQ